LTMSAISGPLDRQRCVGNGMAAAMRLSPV
jgi:hypothetical protein